MFILKYILHLISKTYIYGYCNRLKYFDLVILRAEEFDGFYISYILEKIVRIIKDT